MIIEALILQKITDETRPPQDPDEFQENANTIFRLAGWTFFWPVIGIIAYYKYLDKTRATALTIITLCIALIAAILSAGVLYLIIGLIGLAVRTNLHEYYVYKNHVPEEAKLRFKK